MKVSAKEVDFIASVSHDLKSPLNAIMGSIQLLHMEIASGNYSKESLLSYLSMAEIAGGDMLDMIQNMITTARMQAGREAISPVMLSAGELDARAKNMERTFQNEALCKNVNFSVEVGRLPAKVYWDIQKIRFFAINNLISNALKFLGNKGGTVKVWVDCEDGNNVSVSIMDDGPGIPLSERDNIFGKFNQATNNLDNYQGGGLGLFNAYQIISMHHGKIEILDGLNGKGVTFKVTIPAIPFKIGES
ncbi:MAG: HAMP domain-containing sensor histidine kinase [Gallionellaceae bacterium]